MQPRNVDIGANGLPDGIRPFVPHTWQALLKVTTAEMLDRRTGGDEALHEIGNELLVTLTRDVERAALMQETVLAQVFARSERERHDFRTTIAFFPECRRPPRRMVARLVLPLENQHAGTRFGQFGRQAGTSYPRADNGKIVGHAAPSFGTTRSRNSVIPSSARCRTGSTSRRIS